MEISKRFACLKDLDAEVDIKSAWKNIKFSAKEILGFYKLKNHKPRFDEG
jgi:hypothetical protein